MNKHEYDKIRRHIQAECEKQLAALDLVFRLSQSVGSDSTLEVDKLIEDHLDNEDATRASTRGEVTSAVQSVLPTFKDQPFTWMDVCERLEEVYPDRAFAHGSVRQAVGGLFAKKVIGMVELGSGRRPSRYIRNAPPK